MTKDIFQLKNVHNMTLQWCSGLIFGLVMCCFACRNDTPIQLHHDPNYTHAYACSMDCEQGKTYEQPGDCPVCQMKLVQKEVRIKSTDTMRPNQPASQGQ